MHRVYFTHMYYTNFMEDKRGPHACLDMGYWCSKNALEDPKKALKFWARKVLRLLGLERVSNGNPEPEAIDFEGDA